MRVFTLGQYLKSNREKNNYSLKQVQNLTGITDSRLSKIENDLYEEPSPTILKHLAKLYNVSIIDLFVRAGYITYESLDYSLQTFSDVDKLSDADKEHIQDQINYLVSKHKEVN